MARQRNPDRKNIPVMLTKELDARLRRHVRPSNVRKGNESISDTITRILDVYEKTNPPIHTTPQQTYVSN